MLNCWIQEDPEFFVGSLAICGKIEWNTCFAIFVISLYIQFCLALIRDSRQLCTGLHAFYVLVILHISNNGCEGFWPYVKNPQNHFIKFLNSLMFVVANSSYLSECFCFKTRAIKENLVSRLVDLHTSFRTVCIYINMAKMVKYGKKMSLQFATSVCINETGLSGRNKQLCHYTAIKILNDLSFNCNFQN